MPRPPFSLGRETSALCAASTVLDIPEEHTGQSLDGTVERGRQLDSTHHEVGEGVEHSIKEHDASTREEENGTSSRQVIINLGNQRSKVC